MTPNTPSPTPANGKNPLIRALGLQQLLTRDAETPPTAQSIDDAGSLSALASHVRAAWGRNKLAKMNMDRMLLQCLRERRGVYSPAQIAAMQGSTGGGINFVKADLTETKCRAASAWIREIVIPVGEQPWGIDPDPIPELPDQVRKGIVGKAVQQAQATMAQIQQAGAQQMSRDEFKQLVVQLGTKLRDETEQALVKEAQTRAARMEKHIAQRLDDGGYEHAMDGFVEDFVTYPAAILKGPIYRRHKMLEWGTGWKPLVSDRPLQSWERVSPFDVYPAPSARSPQHGAFIERIRFQREELHALKGLPDYKDEQIDDALFDYSNGHLEGWLWTEAERQRLEQESLYMWLSPPGVIDALNCWDSIPGWKLMTWGVTTVDGKPLEDTRDYDCNVLICGKYILYASVNSDPLGQRPYRKACYDEIPGAFWGRSIPDLCSTSQRMCDGIACALADNLSMASGPMVWVHADRFADGETSQAIYPWRLWQLKSDPNAGTQPGIGFFQANDNSGPLMATYEKWEIRADDATGIPRYTYGNERAGGSADTATGLSMLMNNAAKGLRRAIGNIDMNVISCTINDTFVNEMLYNPDQSIKGACRVVPRGAAAILIKESAQQRRMQWLQLVSGNPVLANLLGPKYLADSLRLVAASLELPVDDVVPSEDAVGEQMQAQMQAAQAQAQAAQQGAANMQTAKEQAIGQREQQLEHAKLLGGIVKDSVSAALAQQSKGGKKVKHTYAPDGSLLSSELQEPGGEGAAPLVSPIQGALIGGSAAPQPAGAPA